MKADLHIHTNYSFDGLSSPLEVVEAAIEKGLDCICITDHGEVEGALEARNYAKDKNILIIPGIEILSKSGDILGINVEKKIPDNLSAEETIREINKVGGLAVIPHPFDWPVENFVGGKKKILDSRVEAIEVFNSSVISWSANKKALKFVKDNNFLFTAGSDAHRAEYIGRGYLETFEDFNSASELIENIKKRRVEIKGRPLSFFEILKNASGLNLKRTKDYWTLKLKR